MANSYTARWRRKYSRYIGQGFSRRLSTAKAAMYAARDVVNILLLWTGQALNLAAPRNPAKTLLFVEPPQQGFGDLLFQTATFRALAERGYEVHVLLSKPEHAAILRGSQHVSSAGTKLPTRRWGWLVALGRDTPREHAAALRFPRARRAYPDANLAAWRKAFAESHAQGWLTTVGAAMGLDLGHDSRPVIAAAAEPQPHGTIGIAAGVTDPRKRVAGLREVALTLATARPVVVLGFEKGWGRMEHPNIDDRVNRQSYAAAIDTLAGCAAAVAPEGSLAHVALALGVPTLVVERDEPYDRFGPSSPLATRTAAADLAAAGGVERVATMVAAVAR